MIAPERPSSNEHRLSWRDVFVAGLLFIASLLLFAYNNDFKIGFHVDERAKIAEAVSGVYYFAHPLFLVRALRSIVLLTQSISSYEAAFFGRMLSAVMASVGVGAVFLLSKRALGSLLAALTALTIAASPLLAIHAHYIKEDASLFGFCALATLMLCRLYSDTSWRTILLAGLAVGLVVSAKLAGFFLVPAYILTVLCQRDVPKGRLLKPLVPVLIVAALVFALINFPALTNLKAVRGDQSFQLMHVSKGGIPPVYSPFDYYITQTLLLDCGVLFCLLAAAGAALLLLKWRQASFTERFLVFSFIVYFSAITITPHKGMQDPGRMALPLLIPFAYFAGYSLKQASVKLAGLHNRWAQAASSAIPALLFFSLVPLGWDTFQLLRDFKNDTRITLMKVLGDNQKYVLAESQALVGLRIPSAFCPSGAPIPKDKRYLVTSSFVSDRLLYGQKHAPEKNVKANILLQKYQELMKTPYCEIRPRYRTYSFSNPTLRVFSLLAISEGIKAEPTSNGSPCTAEIIARLPVKEGSSTRWPFLTDEEHDFLCKDTPTARSTNR